MMQKEWKNEDRRKNAAGETKRQKCDEEERGGITSKAKQITE